MTAFQAIDSAFAERPNIAKRIREVVKASPTHGVLFQDIAQYIQELRPSPVSNGDGRAAKRRKMDTDNRWEAGSYHIVKEISFSVPQRKKFNLEIGEAIGQGIRARNPLTGDIECDIAWSDIENIVCVPVPDKAQLQYNFCIFLRSSTGSLDPEQILWTVPDTIPKAGLVESPTAVSDETYKYLFLRMLNRNHKGPKFVLPDEKEFTGQGIQNSGRKGEKPSYVKAFRGNKDGYLFFLPTGILWGFKKPLAFFAFDAVDSISYTSVLQRTFNLNIASHDHDIEYSMIDQADFAGIDGYIKRHHLQDASMAEQRKAKKLNINGVKEEVAGKDYDEGELEKAQKQAEALDEEDDEEDDENFDPGSEGESEGSGTGDDEDEEGEGDDRPPDESLSTEDEVDG